MHPFPTFSYEAHYQLSIRWKVPTTWKTKDHKPSYPTQFIHWCKIVKNHQGHIARFRKLEERFETKPSLSKSLKIKYWCQITSMFHKNYAIKSSVDNKIIYLYMYVKKKLTKSGKCKPIETSNAEAALCQSELISCYKFNAILIHRFDFTNDMTYSRKWNSTFIGPREKMRHLFVWCCG